MMNVKQIGYHTTTIATYGYKCGKQAKTRCIEREKVAC